jgi:hypothetical protein
MRRRPPPEVRFAKSCARVPDSPSDTIAGAILPKASSWLISQDRKPSRNRTASVETVLAARPDVIFDNSTINPTYVSLADRGFLSVSKLSAKLATAKLRARVFRLGPPTFLRCRTLV